MRSDRKNLPRPDNVLGNQILSEYAAIYKKNFLCETQEDKKIYIDGASGCRSNPKDSYYIDFTSSRRLSDDEIAMLTSH